MRTWIVIISAAVAALLLGRSLMGRVLAPRPEERVRRTAVATEADVKYVCKREGVVYPPTHIFMRAFKQERELELWAAAGDGKMRLLKTYPIVAMSGGPGPKRKEGDRQVPEGVYFVRSLQPEQRIPSLPRPELP